MRLLRSLLPILLLSLHSLAQPKVVIFGVDGLNVYRFDEVETPNFDKLKALGSWTFNAQANETLSSSPNWRSILSGTTPDVHRVLKNGFKSNAYRSDPSCESAPLKFPSIFTLIKQRNRKARIGVFEHWGAFFRLYKGDPVNRHYWYEFKPDPNVKAAMRYYRKRDPELTFIHIDQCDHAGHAHGHESSEYLEAVKKADELLGTVISEIEEKDGFTETTLIVISDHGGKGHGHGSGTPEGLTVPLIVVGPGIKQGHEIKVVAKNEDVAVLAAKALGIQPHECWTAKTLTEIYEK